MGTRIRECAARARKLIRNGDTPAEVQQDVFCCMAGEVLGALQESRKTLLSIYRKQCKQAKRLAKELRWDPEWFQELWHRDSFLSREVAREKRMEERFAFP